MIPDDKKTIVDLKAMFSRSNMKRPPIRARDACTQCLQQVLHRRALAQPFSNSTRQTMEMEVIPGYKFCESCSQVFGCSYADGIDYTKTGCAE